MRSKAVLVFVLAAAGLPASPQTYTYQELSVPNSSGTNITGVNSAGKIVGTFLDNSAPVFYFHGFIYTTGTYTRVDVPGAQDTWVTGINDSGEIVGYYSARDPGSLPS